MLPAGVETNIPSDTNFFIRNFEFFFTDKLAACLLCLKIETSLIAKLVLFLFFCFTFISNGKIQIFFAFKILLLVFFFENLFIKNP